jgi:osmotically inducible lipoprotein OsmB
MKRISQRHPTRHAALACGLVAALMAGGCGTLSEREKATAIGAGVGGVAGSVLTEGSAIGTVGGAAVGGVIGNEVGKRREGR